MARKHVVLIVANPGNLQQGLRALLTALPNVQVHVADDISSALEVAEGHIVSLVILDHDLAGDDVQEKVRQIKVRWTDIRWIVLVNDEQQRQQVQEANGDLVLIKGFPADKLIRVIKEVLSG